MIDVQEAPKAEAQTYTCLITVVEAGKSDAVLKVSPATAKAEKVWLTNRPGVERFEAIMRFLNQYARRGTRVPQPAPYHSDPKNSSKPDLTEDQIPVVNLEEGVIFEVMAEVKPPVPEAKLDLSKDAADARIANLEANMAALASQNAELMAMLRKATGQAAEVPVIAKPSAEDTEALAGGVICPEAGCGKSFKNDIGLRFHRGKFHKEAK